jgi:hypothetical protein
VLGKSRLGCDAGLEAAEAVIRAGVLKLGGGMLEKLLAADPGGRGPRVDCGNGHQAQFTGYRDKVIDTVLGLVTLTRAWYHCAACKRGLAPRDAESGVAGTSLSPGLAAMNDKAAAAGPFATAAGLLADLAGVHLTAKRVERSAESGRRRPPQTGAWPGRSPPASSCRCPRPRCRASCMPPSTAPACR